MNGQATVHTFIVRNGFGVSEGKMEVGGLGINKNIALAYEQERDW